jgi:Flp pilus assembly protein TadG
MRGLCANPRARGVRRRKRKAAAVVELALILPVMLLVVMGVLVIAQLIYFRKSLVIAAAEGVRLAAERTVQADDVEARVSAILTARRIDNVQVDVSPAELMSLTPGSRVTVRVAAPFEAFGMSFLGLNPGMTPAVEASILRE